MQRLILLAYGLLAYLIGMAGLAALVLLLHGWGLGGMADAGNSNAAWPLLIDTLLLMGFAASHSIMARDTFKARLGWSPSAQRASYVLIAGLVAAILAIAWQPMPGALWRLEPTSLAGIALTALGWAGWLLLLVASFAISHTDLFGLRQAWLQFRRRAYTAPPFCVRGFYRYMRHPMMTGFLLAFWCTPDMTSSRLLFALGMSAYIGIGVHLEEATLLKDIGQQYRRYQSTVPMLVPHRPRGLDSPP